MDANIAKPIGIILATVLSTLLAQWQFVGKPNEQAAETFGAEQYKVWRNCVDDVKALDAELRICEAELWECRSQR